MDDKLINQLKTGQQATFIVFQTPEEGVGIPLSLKGDLRLVDLEAETRG
jgi:invasion protein IalB